jgi:hypothetical protein
MGIRLCVQPYKLTDGSTVFDVKIDCGGDWLIALTAMSKRDAVSVATKISKAINQHCTNEARTLFLWHHGAFVIP